MDSIFVGIVILALLSFAIWWMWNDRFREVPLKEFDIPTLQRILRFESPDYRDMVWDRGWMTRKEWRDLVTKQNAEISAELKRRIEEK